jgi:glycerophosphoryl diester phosphodiesterase
MHDDNFRRTTGYNAKAWDLSYDEIAKLDAGSFKGEDFAGERIPLLSEAIELAKEVGIRLNIELKPSVYEEGMEERLVDLLHETEFVDRCVVTSQQYNSISRIKQLDETITTVYVTGFAYGNVNRLIYADHFSVKSTSITPGLVRRVHNAGKQIYAWTVNSRDSINLMIDREVDNIITDNVALAKRCIAQEMASDTVNNLIQFLNRKIRLGSFRFGG